MAMIAERRFPYFHEAAAPPGSTGWESMYPYYLRPDSSPDEPDARFWFADTMHWGRVVCPFDSIGVDAVFLGAGAFGSRVFAIPPALGLDARIVNGYVYLSPVPVTDPAEIARRAEHFQERAGHYYANWDELYARWKDKTEGVIRAMESLSFPLLGELDPVEVATEARGRSTSWDLVESYHRLIDRFFEIWQFHFEMLNIGYGAYITFFEFCKNAFPEIADQTLSRMVAGIDVLAFRPDDELRRLALLAIESGVDGVLADGTDPAVVLARMAETEAGRAWLRAWEDAKDPWFNYSTDYGFLHDQGSWITNLEVPLQGIARYVDQVHRGEEITRPVERLRRERDEFVDEYRALLSDAEATQFDALLDLSRTVFPYIEEHNFFVEHWAHTIFWAKVRELARVLVDQGFLAEAEDVFFLNRFELDEALFDVVESWAIGVPPRGTRHWQVEVQRRRSIVEALSAEPPQPAFGVPPDQITDPFAIMNYGVTTDRVMQWLGDGDGDGGEAGIVGVPGSPGVFEGPVRVIRSERELGDLRDGEVLVAPITAPAWASVFSVARAVVTDIGGMMCHAAIVCREFGIPAVVGSGYATQRLKTGQRVRVDGNTGTVVVLDA